MKMRILAVGVMAAMLVIGLSSPASAEPVDLSAELFGSNEVGEAGDPDGVGTAAVSVDAAAGEVCFTITVSNTAPPAAAHIHTGGAGSNGGVVVNLDWANNDGVGCVSAPSPTLNAILNTPSLYYVNVHTPEFQAGAVRGQLAVSTTATTAGPAELAFTGPGLTSYLAIGGSALVISGAALTQVARRREGA